MPLSTLRILVTRPREQSQNLTDLIIEAGGDAICFPVIKIVPIKPELWPTHALNHADWLIFVSPSAVKCFIEGWQKAIPARIKLVAVGDGTAKIMRQMGLSVHCQPDTSTGSEGLVQQPALQDMNNQNVVIVRGNGGRQLLADTLSARGASISFMEIYRRELVDHTPQARIKAMEADVIICTSGAGIDNLCKILAEYKTVLLCKPLIVVSERLKNYAQILGFHEVLTTSEASDTAVIQTLTKMGVEHGKQ